MPYKSEAQRKKMHSMAAEGDISKKVVREYDEATKGRSLPSRTKKSKGVHAAARSERRGWKGYA